MREPFDQAGLVGKVCKYVFKDQRLRLPTVQMLGKKSNLKNSRFWAHIVSKILDMG